MATPKSSTTRTILIASSSLDEPTWKPVADILVGRGYDVLSYEADHVAYGHIALNIRVDQRTGLTINYAGRQVDLASVAAAWYRRPTIFSGEQDDKALQLSLNTERRMLQYSLWEVVPESAWLSAPHRILHAEHKLTQLVTARAVGFQIPDTIVTNSWDFIGSSLPVEIVVKPSYGMMYANNELKILYTAPLSNDPTKLPLQGNPFPGIWQPRLPKAREWRITIVGDESFDAAIYTEEVAKDDWRKHQLGSGVEFKAEQFPDDQKAKCFEYLAKFDLKFGAFDFTEDHDGNITFLECNANGQFGWLEGDLGFKISESIADELIRIADTGRRSK